MGRRDGFQGWGWKLLLRAESFPQLAGTAVSGRRDGDGPHMAGGLNEGDGGRNVIPRLDAAVGPADGDRSEGVLLKGEAKVLASAGLGGAVITQARGDLVLTQNDLGASDPPIIRHPPVFAGVLSHGETPSGLIGS
ncbi:MAG: hypothetical protein WBB22_11625 [Anaerolineae bacterium]